MMDAKTTTSALSKSKQTLRLTLLGGVLLATAACNSTGSSGEYASFEYRKARGQETAAAFAFEQCIKGADEAATAARVNASMVQYGTAAKMMDRCLGDLGKNADIVPLDDRMIAHAQLIQTHLKAGHPDRARASLAHFKDLYDGRDLLLTDRSSFIDTMEAILGVEKKGFGVTRNVKPEVARELRRIDRWSGNSY